MALVYLDQGKNDFGYGVIFNDALLKCDQKDRDALIDALEKFCDALRGPGAGSKAIN